MKRYLPSSRSRSNINNTSAVGDQLIREFTAQAQAVMQELSAQFADSLQSQASQILQDQLAARIATNIGGGDVATSTDDDSSLFGGLGQLLNTGARYLVSRPRTSTSEIETARSIDATSQFRVSGAQSAAEAQLALTKGTKNL